MYEMEASTPETGSLRRGIKWPGSGRRVKKSSVEFDVGVCRKSKMVAINRK